MCVRSSNIGVSSGSTEEVSGPGQRVEQRGEIVCETTRVPSSRGVIVIIIIVVVILHEFNKRRTTSSAKVSLGD